MGHPGVTPETTLQLYQTLLYWVGWLFVGLACLAALTFLVFLWNECFRSPRRRPVLPRSMDSPAPHPPPETIVGDSLNWSSDSRYIVFGRGRATSKVSKTELFAISPGGGEPHALGLGMDSVRSVSFDPNGHHVAFAAGRDKSDVWLMENFLPRLKAAK